MFCKKCGHEREKSEKFCPVCGEPFLDENGNPYPRGVKKDFLNAKEKLNSRVNDISQKGKKQFEEKIRPQLNKTAENLNHTDWKERKLAAKSAITSFCKDANKVALCLKIASMAFLLWFFVFKAGFAVSPVWYLLALFILYMAFSLPIPEVMKAVVNKRSFSLLVISMIAVMLFFGPSKEDSGTNEEDYKALEDDSPQGRFNDLAQSGNHSWEQTISYGYGSKVHREVFYFYPRTSTSGSVSHAVYDVGMRNGEYSSWMSGRGTYTINGDIINMTYSASAGLHRRSQNNDQYRISVNGSNVELIDESNSRVTFLQQDNPAPDPVN